MKCLPLFVAISVLVGCGKGTTQKHGVNTTMPSGWKKVAPKDADYQFAVPSEAQIQSIPAAQAAELGQAKDISMKEISVASIGQTTMIVCTQTVGLTQPNLKDFVAGYLESLKKQGIVVGDVEQSTITTPTGNATRLKGRGKVADRPSWNISYVWPDSKQIFSLSVTSMGPEDDAFAKQIADTFSIR